MKIKVFISFLFCFFSTTTLLAQDQKSWNQKNANGERIGDWRDVYPGGQYRYQGQFIDGQPVDTFLYYYRDGKLKSILVHHRDTAGHVSAIHFYQTGDTLAKGRYIDQEKDGIWRTYGDQSILLSKGNYLKGKRHGKFITYFPNGREAEIVHYKSGLEEGPYQTFFENGELRQDAFYLEGAKHGQITFYNENGKKDQEGEYVQGLRDGKWLIYNEHELVIKLLKYENGKLLNPEDVDEGDYDTEQYKSQRKDRLNFEDLRGKIRYE